MSMKYRRVSASLIPVGRDSTGASVIFAVSMLATNLSSAAGSWVGSTMRTLGRFSSSLSKGGKSSITLSFFSTAPVKLYRLSTAKKVSLLVGTVECAALLPTLRM